jgi:uncharacterized membrane protein
MANYRHYNLAGEDAKMDKIIREGYNRAAHTYHELDELILRLQKVKKVGANEVMTLKVMKKMIEDVLEVIEEKGTEVNW